MCHAIVSLCLHCFDCLLYVHRYTYYVSGRAVRTSFFEAAAPFNALATSFLAKVASGEVKLPFQAKGLDSVVEDIEVRATAVTDVLTNSG